MITILVNNCNHISQSLYNQILESVEITKLTCPTCGQTGSFIYYGRYDRKVKNGHKTITLNVQRCRCKYCGKTHALLLSALVPYSRITLADQKEILIIDKKGASFDSFLNDNSETIDENTVKYIIRKYKRHWEQRILALGLSLEDELCIPCLEHYSRQFMQIKSTPNQIFIPPT